MIKIVDMADEVWRDLGMPPERPIPYIATWFRNNIGLLNVAISTNFWISRITQEIINKYYQNQNFTPYTGIQCSGITGWVNYCENTCFHNEEKNIFQEIYKVKYYEDFINRLLYSAQYDTIIEVEEGDSHVRKLTKNDLAKSYIILKKEAADRLRDLTMLYKFNKAVAQQVTGDDFITPIPYDFVSSYGPGYYI